MNIQIENRIKKIEFQVEGLLLKGELHLPKIINPPLVVGSHGLEGSKSSAKQMVLARLLPAKGVAFFRFDHRGCGQSQGDFLTDTSLEKRTQDYLMAVQCIMNLNLTSRKLGLFGSSMGGATCINTWESLVKIDINLCSESSGNPYIDWRRHINKPFLLNRDADDKSRHVNRNQINIFAA